jgi:hypothetical protein
LFQLRAFSPAGREPACPSRRGPMIKFSPRAPPALRLWLHYSAVTGAEVRPTPISPFIASWALPSSGMLILINGRPLGPTLNARIHPFASNLFGGRGSQCLTLQRSLRLLFAQHLGAVLVTLVKAKHAAVRDRCCESWLHAAGPCRIIAAERRSTTRSLPQSPPYGGHSSVAPREKERSLGE